MLPELVYIRRPAPGTTPEVRYASANISKDALLDYVGGGWLQDKPIGGYRTLWCTPTNLCGHIGGLTGEAVVSLDARFNIFNMSPWAFMAIVTTIIYLVGQMLVGYIGGLTRRAYRTKIYKKYDDAPSVVPPSDRSLDHGDANGSGGQPSKSQGSAAKRSKSKRSKSD
ncbi:hypothetical protein GGI12_005858 [Dipsacomyces acuminosporus]|nr:hypothetical protein GGI12_005858 [Dipsacomyces acuminosporus]